MRRQTLLLASIIILCTGSIASAHPQLAPHSHGEGLQAGLLHPLLGIDHLLAMIAIGILAARMGGRAIWLVPSTFVACMTIGGIAGMTGKVLQGPETVIAASVLVLGLAAASRKDLPLGVLLVAAGA